MNVGTHSFRSCPALIVLTLLAGLRVCAQTAQQSAPSSSTPLTIDQIETVLKRGDDPSSVATLVRRRGVDFTFNQSAEERLLADKANPALMVAVGTSRRLSTPKDDPEVCPKDWLQYACNEFMVCAAPDAAYDSEFDRILGCVRRSATVHHSQIIAGGYEGAYRLYFRGHEQSFINDFDQRPWHIPDAFSFAMTFSQSEIRRTDGDIEKALERLRDQEGKIEVSPANGGEASADGWIRGGNAATDDFLRLGKYRDSCSRKLADEAEKLSASLPPAAPLLPSTAGKAGGAQACPAGYSSHLCNDGMQILCISPNFSRDDLSKLETSANWKGAGCHAEDTPVPASVVRGDPHKAGYFRGFGAGTVVVRAVNLDPVGQANDNSDFNARLSKLGIYSFGRVVVDPSEAPDCTWSMSWEQGYIEGRKTYVEAIALARIRAKHIEAVQGHQKKSPQ
jgi:hypothetical protein